MEEYNKRTSLLKKSFAELCGAEKSRILLSYDAASSYFSQQNRGFRIFKTEQFSFSTGWDVFCMQRRRTFLRTQRSGQLFEPLCLLITSYRLQEPRIILANCLS